MSVKILRQQRLFRGRVFNLVQKQIRFPDGHETTYDIVEHPGAVAIVPLFDDDSLLLVKQFRPAVRKELYEIPAGTLDRANETPLACAKRELLEETGYIARRWKKLLTLIPVPGYSSEAITLYTATGLKRGCFQWDAEERVRPVRLPFRRALEWIRHGKICDGKSIVGLYVVAERQGMRQNAR